LAAYTSRGEAAKKGAALTALSARVVNVLLAAALAGSTERLKLRAAELR
jgi:hypothetical protein